VDRSRGSDTAQVLSAPRAGLVDLTPVTSGGSKDRRSIAPGTGVVSVQRSGSKSVVLRAFASSPLRLLSPRNHGSAAWLYTATYGGGLVDGDALDLTISVGDAAALLLSTQASTKVYRSPAGTRVELEADVGEEALLVLAPDPVVCFAGASYTQVQRLNLTPTGGVVIVDWLTSGRRARGERWAFDNYVASLTIHRDGRLLVYDSLALGRADGDLRQRMQRFEVVCVVAIVGRRLREYAQSITARVADSTVQRHADLIVGASRLGDDGCVLRLMGVSVEQVAYAVRSYLQFLPGILGDDPWTRKW
jgi:urease accessory protein